MKKLFVLLMVAVPIWLSAPAFAQNKKVLLQKQNETSKNVTKLTGDVNAMNTKVNNLGEKENKTAQKVDAVDSKIEILLTSMNTLQKGFASFKDSTLAAQKLQQQAWQLQQAVVLSKIEAKAASGGNTPKTIAAAPVVSKDSAKPKPKKVEKAENYKAITASSSDKKDLVKDSVVEKKQDTVKSNTETTETAVVENKSLAKNPSKIPVVTKQKNTIGITATKKTATKSSYPKKGEIVFIQKETEDRCGNKTTKQIALVRKSDMLAPIRWAVPVWWNIEEVPR